MNGPCALIILADTREQSPLWEPGRHVEHGLEFTVERATLRTADYALAGFEDLALIERKASIDELAACVGYGRPRFERELARMYAETQHRLLVIEEPAVCVQMHRYRSRVSPSAIFGSLASWAWRYGLHVYWAGTREIAREVVLRTLAAAARDPERLRRQIPEQQGVA